MILLLYNGENDSSSRRGEICNGEDGPSPRRGEDDSSPVTERMILLLVGERSATERRDGPSPRRGEVEGGCWIWNGEQKNRW